MTTNLDGTVAEPHRRVLKWVCEFGQETAIGGGKVVLVAEQAGYPVVWTEEDGRFEETRTIIVLGTGHRIPDDFSHLGSFTMYDGAAVWHLYQWDGRPTPATPSRVVRSSSEPDA